MKDIEQERIYLHLSSLLVIFPAGFGVGLVYGMLAGISAVFLSGGFLLFFRTIMNLKIAELTLTLEQIEETK